MAELVPLKAVYDGSSICGLSELRDGDVVGVEHGGLGVCTIPSNTLLIGNGQGAISTTSALTTNGQIIIGGTGGPQIANLTGTSNEVEITDGNGAITIGLPATVQIATNLKTPAFSITNEYCLPTSDGSAGQIMCTNGSGALAFVDFDGTGHCIAFSGTTVADRTCLNFLGGGVTVSDNSGTNATDITIPVTTPELKVRNTSGSELSIQLDNAAIGGELICDTTPQLGGTLDVNGYAISSVSNCNISISPNGTGSVILDGLSWPQADGTAGYILCTDGSGSLSWAADAAGGSAAGSNNEIQYNSSGSFGASSNLTFAGSTLQVLGTAGVGIARTEGTLHVHTASSGSGATPSTSADDLIVENDTYAGISILSPSDSYGQIYFGDVEANQQGRIQYGHDTDSLNFAAAGTERMRICCSGNIHILGCADEACSKGGVMLRCGSFQSIPCNGCSNAVCPAFNGLRNTINGTQFCAFSIQSMLLCGSCSTGGGNNCCYEGAMVLSVGSGYTYGVGDSSCVNCRLIVGLHSVCTTCGCGLTISPGGNLNATCASIQQNCHTVCSQTPCCGITMKSMGAQGNHFPSLIFMTATQCGTCNGNGSGNCCYAGAGVIAISCGHRWGIGHFDCRCDKMCIAGATCILGGALCSTGNMCVGGTLGKSAGSFVINHPCCGEEDTPNSYNAMNLVHGFSEGPKYGIQYDGTSQLNDRVTTVKMPEYFNKLQNKNGTVHIQLTNVAGWSPLVVMEYSNGCKICGNCFKVCTTAEGDSSAKFDWFLTAERGDDFVINDNEQTDDDGHLIVEQWRDWDQIAKPKETLDALSEEEYTEWINYRERKAKNKFDRAADKFISPNNIDRTKTKEEQIDDLYVEKKFRKMEHFSLEEISNHGLFKKHQIIKDANIDKTGTNVVSPAELEELANIASQHSEKGQVQLRIMRDSEMSPISAVELAWDQNIPREQTEEERQAEADES